MIIKTSINPEVFTHKAELNYQFVIGKQQKLNFWRLLWAALGVLIGGLLVYNDDYVGFFFIGIGLHFLINFFNFQSQYAKTKESFTREVSAFLDQFEGAEQSCLWEFNQEHLGYSDAFMELKVKWTALTGFRLLEEVLFVDADPIGNNPLMLAKSEVSEEEWDSIMALVNEKLTQVNQAK